MKKFKRITERLAEKIVRKIGLFSESLSDGKSEHANRRTFVIIGVLVGTLLLPYLFFMAPPRAFPAGELIEVREGMSLSEIAELLKAEHVVRSEIIFKASVYVLGRERDIKFGDYLFKTPQSVFSVARALSYGVYGLEPIRVRIPEGAMVREIAALFAAHLERFNEARFLAAALSLEGYLFPDTYFFLPNADDRLVLRTMRQNFDAHAAELEEDITAFGRSLEDVVTMASILEREAHNIQDRRIIAGVLWKRLEINMPLQVDAVFLYSIGRTTFDLTSTDLASDSPYNTYRVRGLPPTPIGSPSLESLRAAITPIESRYLYYLADRNYRTYYSETYEEHLEKRRIYLGS